MRVLIVNTSEKRGGAAVAANRLMAALNNNGVKAKMLVREKDTEDPSVVELGRRSYMHWLFLWERWLLYCRLGFNKKHLFDIDSGHCGTDITGLREFKEADVIHLHWVNQGMLSLKDLRRILDSGKPVVWTMHDMWPAMALCHYALDCHKYLTQCRECPLVPHNGLFGDFAAKIWKRKDRLYASRNSICFVACSRWLAAETRRSRLMTGQKIAAIPNPIDTHIFCRTDSEEARRAMRLPLDKKLICFVAQKVTNKIKGMDYLIEACKRLAEEHPELKESMGIVILGGHVDDLMGDFGFPVYPLSYISDPRMIAQVYNSVDLFVTPSLQDNLPNTIMEAMACGVPCVGFNVGGIPEMIDHNKNGYVAEYRSAADFAKGIHRVLFGGDYKSMSDCAISKVTTCYSQQSVAMKYIEIYNQALAFRHYRI